MNLGNIDGRQQRLLIIAIVAVGLLGGERLVLNPLKAAWQGREARLTELKRSVARGTSLLSRDRNIRGEWGQMRTNALTGQTSAAQNQMIKAFNRWARESGVTLGSIRPQWKQLADDSLALECRADATGNLGALTRFLYEAETDPLAVRVESLEMTTRDPEGQQLTLGLQVSGLLLKSSGT